MINIYTDGFKSEIEMEAAATTGNRTVSASLPKYSSMITAGTNAIHLALDKMSSTKGKIFSVMTDSRSNQQALQKQILTNLKSTKTEAHHKEPKEIRKNSGNVMYLDTQVFQETKSQVRKPKRHRDCKKKL